jgi:SacI homology domain
MASLVSIFFAAPQETFEGCEQLTQILLTSTLEGLLSIASFSFLLCITRREEVAQIFGTPIYVIKDVVILPLSSRAEVDQAVIQARASLRKANSSQDSDTASSVSEESGHDSVDDQSVGDPSESQSPANESLQTSPRTERHPSVVQDVIERKGQYGRFASQWFSRRVWGLDKKRDEGMSREKVPKTDHARQKLEPVTCDSTSGEESSAKISEAIHHYSADDEVVTGRRASHDAAIQMLPNILRTTKLLFSSRSFYFSYDFNITKRFGSSSVSSLRSPSPENVDQQVRGCSTARGCWPLMMSSISGTDG